MKHLVLILFTLLPYCVIAQAKHPFEGFRTWECERFLIERFAHKDSILTHLSNSILTNETHTIYIKKADHIENLPDSINGYAIKMIDFEEKENLRFLYNEQQDNHAAILYLSNAIPKFSYYSIYVMPVQMVKVGNRIKADYRRSTCKALFFFNDASAKFSYDSIECN